MFGMQIESAVLNDVRIIMLCTKTHIIFNM